MTSESREIAAVILTGGTFLVFENVLHLKVPFLIGSTILWTLYLVARVMRDRSVLQQWGFRRDTLRPASIACLVCLGVGGGAILAYRLIAGWRPLPVTALVVFALYPLWGLVQQFLVQALVAENLKRLGVGRAIIVPVAAVLFGLAHLPDWPLVAITAGAGVIWTPIFLWRPNLLPLAITHGWLGGLVFYWVLVRDPWAEFFGAP